MSTPLQVQTTSVYYSIGINSAWGGRQTLKTLSLLFHQLLQQIQLTAFTFIEYLANR